MKKRILFILMTLILILGTTYNASNAKILSLGLPLDHYSQLIYPNQSPILIQGDFHFHIKAAIEGWDLSGSRDGTITKPYKISAITQIEIQDTTVYFEIINNSIDILSDIYEKAISLINVTNGIIQNNLINSRFEADYGIMLKNSRNNVITDNFITSFEMGIIFVAASDNTIQNNTITGHQGVIIGPYSNNNSVLNNLLLENYIGISLSGSNNKLFGNNISSCHVGMLISNVSVINISYNDVSDCDTGLRIRNSSSGSISHNVFKNNDIGGFFEFGGYNFTIFWNVFVSDGVTSSQFLDNSYNNTFIFNYWDDWIEPDKDMNGFVDFPYLIDGDANNSDLFPLVLPHSMITTTLTIQTETNTFPLIPFFIFLVILTYLIIITKKEKK